MQGRGSGSLVHLETLPVPLPLPPPSHDGIGLNLIKFCSVDLQLTAQFTEPVQRRKPPLGPSNQSKSKAKQKKKKKNNTGTAVG